MIYDDKTNRKIESYKNNKPHLTEKERAATESFIWRDLEPKPTGKAHARGKWFVQQFGGSVAEYEFRQTIADSIWSEEIWELLLFRINRDKISLYTAVRCLRLAKAHKQLGCYNDQAIGIAIKEIVTDRLKSAKEAKSLESSKSSREFLKSMNILVDRYIRNHLDKGASDTIQEKLSDKYRFLIRVDYDMLREDIHRMKDSIMDSLSSQSVKKAEFIRASSIIGFQCKFGQPIDRSKLIKKYKEKSLVLHPDRTNGNELKTQEFIEVTKAFEILNKYNEQIGEI